MWTCISVCDCLGSVRSRKQRAEARKEIRVCRKWATSRFFLSKSCLHISIMTSRLDRQLLGTGGDFAFFFG